MGRQQLLAHALRWGAITFAALMFSSFFTFIFGGYAVLAMLGILWFLIYKSADAFIKKYPELNSARVIFLSGSLVAINSGIFLSIMTAIAVAISGVNSLKDGNPNYEQLASENQEAFDFALQLMENPLSLSLVIVCYTFIFSLPGSIISIFALKNK